jgi:hypothetical protein
VLQELHKADALGNRDKWAKLAKQSQSEGWPRGPDTFREIFESEYLEDITFVNVSGMFEDDPIAQKVRLRGASDTPTAQLAVLLARARPIVHSHDHSLWEPGLAPAPERVQVVITAGRPVESADTTMHGTSTAGRRAIPVAADVEAVLDRR